MIKPGRKLKRIRESGFRTDSRYGDIIIAGEANVSASNYLMCKTKEYNVLTQYDICNFVQIMEENEAKWIKEVIQEVKEILWP